MHAHARSLRPLLTLGALVLALAPAASRAR